MAENTRARLPVRPASPTTSSVQMAALGRTARVPARWIYVENDQSYGPDLARRMFGAYTAGGALAQLNVLPPFETDGHDLVRIAPADSWFSSVEPFLAGLSLPTARVAALPPFAELPV